MRLEIEYTSEQKVEGIIMEKDIDRVLLSEEQLKKRVAELGAQLS